MKGNKFWMVLMDDTMSTTYKHESLESARSEAERLLKQDRYNGRGVTILEAIEYGKIVWPPVEWSTYRGGTYQGTEITPDIPF